MTSGMVYSTEHGKICPGCSEPIAGCRCRRKGSVPKEDGIVRVLRETKGRKGKGVTLIKGVPLHPEGVKALAKALKQTCGSGGTVKEGVIEIQGDHRNLIIQELGKKGYTVKGQ
jgi:translation initiation factor 1